MLEHSTALETKIAREYAAKIRSSEEYKAGFAEAALRLAVDGDSPEDVYRAGMDAYNNDGREKYGQGMMDRAKAGRASK